MLRIKDNVDLKELYKYGFKRKYYNGTKNLVLEYELKDHPHKYQDIVFDIPTLGLGIFAAAAKSATKSR